MSAYPLAYMDVETCFWVRNRIEGRTDRTIAAIAMPKIIFNVHVTLLNISMIIILLGISLNYMTYFIITRKRVIAQLL
jgi:hypothetical protein